MLADAADWYRFETTDVGDATSFVQIDFDHRRGDLDLGLYRLVDTPTDAGAEGDPETQQELVPVRVDGLNFGDSARITLLGQPAGTYFVHVFDDRGGLQPFYTLTIDPPGRLDAGIEAQIGDFSVRDTALEINIDSNLEFSGYLGGRLVMGVDGGNQVGTQSSETVELAFRAQIDTVADDPDDNGGFSASLSTGVGGQAVSVLDLKDAAGNSIATPTEANWSVNVKNLSGGYLIFDYQSASDFKFAGLNAALGRWEIGAVSGDSVDSQWVVPAGRDYRAVADLSDPGGGHRMSLIINGNNVELWISKEGQTTASMVLSHRYNENLYGSLGLGVPGGRATFDNATLLAGIDPDSTSGTIPQFETNLFFDAFLDRIDEKWRIETGVWNSNGGLYVANSSGIELGDYLLIDRAKLTGTIDVQFNDNNILELPPLRAEPVEENDDDEDEGSIVVSIELSELNALLFQVSDVESGTPLYPGDPNSPEGLVAIRDGGIKLTPGGAVLTAGSASAGLRNVVFVTINDARIDLTADVNQPLLQAGDIEIRVPALSEEEDFVTISGADVGPVDPGDGSDPVYPALFGLSKPTLTDPIPDFLFLQDEITVDLNASAIQKKLDVGGVFPFKFEKVGLRFNDAKNVDGQISNLSDFDLLVAGQFDLTNAGFSVGGVPFTPIFAIDQPDLPAPSPGELRVSNPNAYQLTCDRGISIFSDEEFSSVDLSDFSSVLPADESALCRNGYVSTELNIGALLGNGGPLIKELGPIYVGFKNVHVFDTYELTGLARLGGFQNGQFVPDVAGVVHLVDDPPFEETKPVATLGIGGQFEGPTVIDPANNIRQTKLSLSFFGGVTGELGEVFGATLGDVGVNLSGEFIRTFDDDGPISVSGGFQLRSFEANDLCVPFGDYITLCGSAVVAPAAGPDQPVFVIKDGTLKLGEELGPLAGFEIEAGGFGIGGDGTIYVLPAGYFIPDPDDPDNRSADLATFPDGAYIALGRDADGGLFGFPDWVPLEIRKIGLAFNGVADPRDQNAPAAPLIVGPPTLDEVKALGSEPDAVRRLGDQIVNDLLIPITDPDNLSIVISGGLEGTGIIPLTGNVERLKVNLGHLAGCVAVAAENVSPELLDFVPGYIFDSACQFPIEGINGIKIGIEPFELGPLNVGGTLGIGMFTFDRPVDPDDPNYDPLQPTQPQNVFYGELEAELSISGVGFGADIILTQYGPVLARFKPGVPIEVGLLVGSLGGPVGAAAGAASGFIITDWQGGLIFGGDPLPVVTEPTDIFTNRSFRNPLKLTTADIENAVRDLAFENPTFAQIIDEVTDINGTIDELLDYQQVLVDLASGRIPTLPIRFTWDKGFRAVVSGTLTNRNVAAQLGLAVTLGLNVGYDFETLLPDDNTLPDPLPSDWPVHTPNDPDDPKEAPIPAMDAQGYALDREGNRLDVDGNPVAQGITDTLATFDDLFGFQLYGFADVEIFGFKVVGAGLLMDFTDPVNPVFNIAAGLPAAPSLISLLLPSQGTIGLQLDTQGYIEGQLLAMLAFLEKIQADFLSNGDDGSTSSFFYDVLQEVRLDTIDGVPSPLEVFARRREADRRVATFPADPQDPSGADPFDLSDVSDPR